MNKSEVIRKVIEALQSELETYIRAAKFSYTEATAEENRAENKYDTRGLEASYLAAGQANKVAEIERSIEAVREMEGMDLSDEPIAVGALVELRQNDCTNHFFIGSSTIFRCQFCTGYEPFCYEPFCYACFWPPP